jgi:hypothetical protein
MPLLFHDVSYGLSRLSRDLSRRQEPKQLRNPAAGLAGFLLGERQ